MTDFLRENGSAGQIKQQMNTLQLAHKVGEDKGSDEPNEALRF